MNAVVRPVASGDVTSRAAPVELSLLRLYTLRVAYFTMAAGIGVYFWPSVIHHTNDFAIAQGIRFALLAGLGLVAALGLRYPIQMIPILLFELTWKATYLIAFALPLWKTHAITPAAAQDITAVAMVVILVPLIPWRYVFAHYALKRGERWK